MKRDYKSGTLDNVTFFTGVEIEHTPAFDMQTLFVVGVQNPHSILEIAGENYCTHIYFGANQSFDADGIIDKIEVWRPWENMIRVCLETGYWCTLDLDVKDAPGLLESGLIENRRFIPQISVKIPGLQMLGYNATIKIDDIGFDATNPGVWCHRLRDLTTTEAFTGWDAYGQDEILK